MSLDQLTSTTTRKVIKVMPDQYHNRFVAMREMYRMGNVQKQTGREVHAAFEYQETSAGGYVDGDHTALTPAEETIIVGTYFSWCYALVPMYMSQREARKNSGPEQLFNLAEKKGDAAMKRLQRLQNTYIYTGVGTSNTPLGFDYFIKTSGTVGDLDIGTYTTYQGKTKTISGGVGALIMDDINDLMADCMDDNEGPKIALSDWDIWQQLQKLTNPQATYVGEKYSARQLNGKSFEASAMTFVFDKHAPAGKIYLIDPETWYLIYNGPESTYGVELGSWEKRVDYGATLQYVVALTGQNICVNSRKNGVLTINS